MNVVVLGAGRWGPNHIRNFHSMKCVTSCVVVDTNPDCLKEIVKLFPDIVTYQSFDEALKKEELDAVVIATPVFTHFDIAQKALERGLHTLVEKPMCAKSDEIKTLNKLAKKVGKVLMVNHVFLYNNSIRAVKEVLQSGTLGDILYLKSNRTNLGPVRLDVNALWDLASHDISIFNYWLDDKPLDAFVTGIQTLNKGIDDMNTGIFSYKGGVVAEVHASWLNPFKTREITVVGSEKMLSWNDLDEVQVRIFDKGVTAGDQRTDSFDAHKTVVHSGGIVIPTFDVNEPLLTACEHFMDCIYDNKPCLTDGANAYEVVRILEVADQSREKGQVISIDWTNL